MSEEALKAPVQLEETHGDKAEDGSLVLGDGSVVSDAQSSLVNLDDSGDEDAARASAQSSGVPYVAFRKSAPAPEVGAPSPPAISGGQSSGADHGEQQAPTEESWKCKRIIRWRV